MHVRAVSGYIMESAYSSVRHSVNFSPSMLMLFSSSVSLLQNSEVLNRNQRGSFLGKNCPVLGSGDNVSDLEHRHHVGDPPPGFPTLVTSFFRSLIISFPPLEPLRPSEGTDFKAGTMVDVCNKDHLVLVSVESGRRKKHILKASSGF